MKSISSTTTLDILSLLDSNYTARQIAPRVGVSIGTVSMVRKNHRPNMPKSLGGKGDGQNPEMLFAMGYACKSDPMTVVSDEAATRV